RPVPGGRPGGCRGRGSAGYHPLGGPVAPGFEAVGYGGELFGDGAGAGGAWGDPGRERSPYRQNCSDLGGEVLGDLGQVGVGDLVKAAAAPGAERDETAGDLVRGAERH